MTVIQDRALAVLSPMWQRIARGEVDLGKYSDEEILDGCIYMADGRRLPAPKVFPDVFIKEQRRRGLVMADRKVREGGMAALDTFRDILDDDTQPTKDRLKAGEFFLSRWLGPETKNIRVSHEGEDPREVLLRRLIAARDGESEPDEVVDAVVVDDLEDIL